tara:strand:- start:58 stop:429 length:372 start_codon:yes stop_codon:yes gene_type:complete
MTVYNGNVKIQVMAEARRLTIVPASDTDTVTVYNNDGSNGALDAMACYTAMKKASMDEAICKKYNIKGMQTPFNPNGNGNIPTIMIKERKNSDGSISKSVYMALFNDKKEPRKATSKAVDLSL